MFKIFTFKNLKYFVALILIALIGVSIYSVTKRYIDNSIDNGVVTYFNDHKEELKGDKGDEGVTGEQGVQGKVGNTGVTGRAGVKGATGVAGDKGSTGAQGYTGATGRSGNDGCTWMPYSKYWYCP